MRNKKKILVVANNLWPPPVLVSGMSVVYELQKRLARRGFEVHILTMIGDWERNQDYFSTHSQEKILSWFRREEKKWGLVFHHFDPSFFKSLPKLKYFISRIYTYFLAKKLQQEHNYDLIHEYSGCPWLAKRTALYKRLGVATLHTVIGEVPGFIYSYQRVKGGIQSLDRFICTSRTMEKKLLSVDYPKSALAYLPFGFNEKKFARLSSQQILRKKLEIPVGKTVFLYLNPLEEKKGYQIYLKAVKKILTSGRNDLFFLLATYPSLPKTIFKKRKKSVQKIAKKYRANFKYLEGFLSVPELMRASNCVVLPQLTVDAATSYPVTALEALASGACLIATDFKNIREIVGPKTGFLIQPGSTYELIEKIKWVGDHPRQARLLGRAGRQFVFSRFSLENVVEQLEEIIQQVI